MSVSLAAIGIPQDIGSMIQERTLERLFHEALFPAQLYRREAEPSLWPVNLGERMVFTRTGLMPVSVTPAIPGTDPIPGSHPIEQWEAEANQYFNTIDTHMPTSYVSLASTYIKNIQTLGLNAGQTINRVARNRLFRAYLGGNTVTLAAAVITGTSIRVASLNGFTERVSSGRPQPVSSMNPLPITFPGVVGEPANTVVGAIPDDLTNPFGPGTLLLGAGFTTAAVARSPVYAETRSRIRRQGGFTSVDGLTAANVLTAQTILDAVAALRDQNVPPTADGTYHVHLTATAEAQIFADNQFQRIYQSIPQDPTTLQGAIAELYGCRFYRNTESPSESNTGALISTGSGGAALALESPEIGGEVVNNAGLPIRRTIIVGGGAMYEKYLDESKFISEAGVTGKVGHFQVTNNGVIVNTDRIRLVLRSPLDRVQQVVSSSWSWSGDFPVPSDGLSGNLARYKRALVIEHA